MEHQVKIPDTMRTQPEDRTPLLPLPMEQVHDVRVLEAELARPNVVRRHFFHMEVVKAAAILLGHRPVLPQR